MEETDVSPIQKSRQCDLSGNDQTRPVESLWECILWEKPDLRY